MSAPASSIDVVDLLKEALEDCRAAIEASELARLGQASIVEMHVNPRMRRVDVFVRPPAERVQPG